MSAGTDRRTVGAASPTKMYALRTTCRASVHTVAEWYGNTVAGSRLSVCRASRRPTLLNRQRTDMRTSSIARRQPTLKTLQRQVDDWNAKVSVGATVEYRSHPGAEPQQFTTRTPAEILGGHTSVVWLDGKSGCVATEACRSVAPKD